MALEAEISILDYLPFDDLEFLRLINRSDLMVAATYRDALEKLKELGIGLSYNWSKTQGILILNRAGTKLGEVTVFGRPEWRKELLDNLETLAANPKRYGLT